MASKLIKLEDGTLVEVQVPADQAEKISGGLATSVSTTIEKSIRPVLMNICRPVTALWKEMDQEMNIDQTEIEVGFSFEAEGNLYVTKTKGGANLTIRLVLKPKESRR